MLTAPWMFKRFRNCAFDFELSSNQNTDRTVENLVRFLLAGWNWICIFCNRKRSWRWAFNSSQNGWSRRRLTPGLCCHTCEFAHNESTATHTEAVQHNSNNTNWAWLPIHKCVRVATGRCACLSPYGGLYSFVWVYACKFGEHTDTYLVEFCLIQFLKVLLH